MCFNYLVLSFITNDKVIKFTIKAVLFLEMTNLFLANQHLTQDKACQTRRKSNNKVVQISPAC